MEIRATPATTVAAEIMFVPDKVTNREETHLAGDRRASNLSRVEATRQHAKSTFALK